MLDAGAGVGVVAAVDGGAKDRASLVLGCGRTSASGFWGSFRNRTGQRKRDKGAEDRNGELHV